MKFKKSLFIFRRDLRLTDNTALLEASRQSARVIPVFIFDPRQIGPHPYRSAPALKFMLSSLRELDLELKSIGSSVLFLIGHAEEVIPQLIKKLQINAIFCSRDYTPFSIRRDELIEHESRKQSAEFFSLPNLLLNEPEKIKSLSGTPYTIYTFFAKTSAKIEVATPEKIIPKNISSATEISGLPLVSLDEIQDRYISGFSFSMPVQGGRKEAIKKLSAISSYGDYTERRNFPALDATTHLSAHNKFGTISIREFYHAVKDSFGNAHTLISEIYWRDFFSHIAFHFPHVFSGAFNKTYDRIEWQDNDSRICAWQNGETGFPIVDAGMRELNATGFMHNRVRMITASFLCKDLLADWHHGERYFASKLVDYDPAVNNGNWQWAASTGCDAQPYFRIFNPWTQAEKFDRDATYIKRWVPELADLEAKKIHRLFREDSIRPKNYPRPIVDHSEQSTRAKRMFERAKEFPN